MKLVLSIGFHSVTVIAPTHQGHLGGGGARRQIAHIFGMKSIFLVILQLENYHPTPPPPQHPTHPPTLDIPEYATAHLHELIITNNIAFLT